MQLARKSKILRETISERADLPDRAYELVQKWEFSRDLDLALRAGKIQVLADAINTIYTPARATTHPLRVSGQICDAQLLHLSPIYLKSRQMFLETGGQFTPVLVSKFRGTSEKLLTNTIEYSPLEAELVWVCQSEKRYDIHDPKVYEFFRSSVTPIFHEQNHRILWHALPPPPSNLEALSRYLNFAESLVFALDTACSDQLGTSLSLFFSASNTLINEGAHTVWKALGRKKYRRYLQSYAFASYLYVHQCEIGRIAPLTQSLFPDLEDYARISAETAMANVDIQFIRVGVPGWLKTYLPVAQQMLTTLRGGKTVQAPLDLPENLADIGLFCKLAEAVFLAMGL